MALLRAHASWGGCCAAPGAISGYQHYLANNDGSSHRSSQGSSHRNSRRSSHGGRLGGRLAARVYDSSKPFVAQAREPTRFPFIGTAEAPKVPPSPMPAAATAARKHIRILDIVTLRLSSTCWRVAKTSHLCLRATALMQINTAVCEAHRARRRGDRIKRSRCPLLA